MAARQSPKAAHYKDVGRPVGGHVMLQDFEWCDKCAIMTWVASPVPPELPAQPVQQASPVPPE
ncbi:MAG TPA: hypothetical protein PLE42_02525, partial [Candidatus Competibacteraceae bacterium]|nr:hypothetical protein [Candidatus Competibacteraceae bacterium]